MYLPVLTCLCVFNASSMTLRNLVDKSIDNIE